MHALKNREKIAVEALYDMYSSSLYGVISRIIIDTPTAEDVLQETFVKIWHSFPSYSTEKGRLFTWMINLTRNLTIDTLRSKNYKKQQKISADENSVSNLSNNYSGSERFDTIGLRKQLENLKPEQRCIIDLAYFSGYTQDEIAKEIGIPLGTVKTRMRTAIIELRKML